MHQPLPENLLTWSRIQRGAMEYEPGNLDLFISKAEQKELTLKNSIAKGTLAYADSPKSFKPSTT